MQRYSQPGERKTAAIKEFPVAQNIHKVRQFIGLTFHFVKNYADIARPLTELLKKNKPWEWTEKQNQALEALKQALTERPILAIYHLEFKTEVHTDASSHGLGGMLLQYSKEGRLHPVQYYSKPLPFI